MLTCRRRNVMFFSRSLFFWNVSQNRLLLDEILYILLAFLILHDCYLKQFKKKLKSSIIASY